MSIVSGFAAAHGGKAPPFRLDSDMISRLSLERRHSLTLGHSLIVLESSIRHQLNPGAIVSIRVRAAGSSSPTVARKFGCFIPDPRNVQRSA